MASGASTTAPAPSRHSSLVICSGNGAVRAPRASTSTGRTTIDEPGSGKTMGGAGLSADQKLKAGSSTRIAPMRTSSLPPIGPAYGTSLPVPGQSPEGIRILFTVSVQRPAIPAV